MTENRVYKATVSKLQAGLDEFKRHYIEFVTKNPAAVDQIERTVKTASYLFEALSANYETSIFISELVSSACNLFAYINSRLLKKSKKIFNQATNELVEKVKQLLIIIEVCQAFIEISAGRIGGSGARWAVIVIICLLKAILRCLLLFIFGTGIHSQSLVSFLKSSASNVAEKTDECDPEIVYVGSRTGHKMKTLAGLSSEKASCSKMDSVPSFLQYLPPTPLTKSEQIGEFLHVIRPLLHVLACGVLSSKSIVPWLVALVADTSSHALLQRPPVSSSSTLPPYNVNEKNELRRRYANLSYYLMRSPVYDRFTQKKLLKLFSFLSNRVPLAHYLFEPLSKYIPEWQKIYFYTWAD